MDPSPSPLNDLHYDLLYALISSSNPLASFSPFPPLIHDQNDQGCRYRLGYYLLVSIFLGNFDPREPYADCGFFRCVGVWQNDRVEIIANDRTCNILVITSGVFVLLIIYQIRGKSYNSVICRFLCRGASHW